MSALVTQEQIAQQAGVSKATVSCALRGRANVSPAVRKRIQKIADRLGYCVNPLLAAHMTHLRAFRKPEYQATLALLACSNFKTADEVELNKRYTMGCVERAAELGYKVEIFDYFDPEMSMKRLSNIWTSRGIHGVVIAPLSSTDISFELEWQHFASVALGYSLRYPHLDRICHHNFDTMERLLGKLVAAGYKRIGLAMSEFADSRVNHLWLGGYLAHRHYMPDLATIPPLITADWTESTFMKWFTANRPDVVVSSTTEALSWLRSKGWRVPQETGFANVFWTKADKTCSGFDQNFEKIGAAAIDLVLSRLNRNERGVPTLPKVVLVEGTWVPGSTLRQSAPKKRVQAN